MAFCRHPGRSVSNPGVVALVALGAALAWPAAGGPVRAGEVGSIVGDVRVVTPSSRRLVTAGAYPGRHVGLPGEQVSTELDNVIVYVDVKGPGAPPPMRATIRQVDEEFVPHVVSVTTGSTVDFPNDDLIFHNVFSLSRSATFDLGRYPRGASKSRTFNRPGIVKVFCHLHSHMSAIVRVFDHPHFATPDDEGRFTLPNLAPGRYDVVAWHERVGEVTHNVTVTAGQASTLSFSLPLTDSR